MKVSKMLGFAFVLSITGIFGVGSLIALIVGLKALRIISESKGSLGGRLMAWWCIVAGALGSLILIPLTIFVVFEQWK